MILVGDIGGTTTRLAVATREGDLLALSLEPSRGELVEVVARYRAATPEAREGRVGALAVAGPVRHGRCEATNLPWVIDAARLAHRLELDRVVLLNDLEAAAWGLDVVAPDRLHALQTGVPDPGGTRALVFPGTGLGQAVWLGPERGALAGEGGHRDFAPTDELQVELWRYLAARHGHVSWERLLSGPGLVALHEFICHRTGRAVPPPIRAAADPGAAVATAAREGPEPTARAALDLFWTLLGAEAGNAALTAFASGGVYLGGSTVVRNLGDLETSGFLAAFRAKGRFGRFLADVPVWVVLDEVVNLRGAAAFARRQLRIES